MLLYLPRLSAFSIAPTLTVQLISVFSLLCFSVFGRQDSLDYLDACPKVVIISYKMLSHLRKSMITRRWALMIIDESHNIRCTKMKQENNQVVILSCKNPVPPIHKGNLVLSIFGISYFATLVIITLFCLVTPFD
jgi:hypothetical protein